MTAWLLLIFHHLLLMQPGATAQMLIIYYASLQLLHLKAQLNSRLLLQRYIRSLFPRVCRGVFNVSCLSDLNHNTISYGKTTKFWIDLGSSSRIIADFSAGWTPGDPASNTKARAEPAKPAQSELLEPDVCFVTGARRGSGWRKAASSALGAARLKKKKKKASLTWQRRHRSVPAQLSNRRTRSDLRNS